jgi:hypothetical protein
VVHGSRLNRIENTIYCYFIHNSQAISSADEKFVNYTVIVVPRCEKKKNNSQAMKTAKMHHY